MTRKISVLFVLALFLVSLAAVSALGARANTVGHSGVIATEAKLRTSPDAAEENLQNFGGKPGTSVPTALGYYMLGSVSIGSSAFDHQSNDRQQRQIVLGCGGNVHNVFIQRPGGGGDRTVQYVAYVWGTTPGAAGDITAATGGYGAIDKDPISGKAIAAWHYTPAGADTRGRTQANMQTGCGVGTFPNVDYPGSPAVSIPNCEGIRTGISASATYKENGYLWPSVAGDNNGGSAIAHVLSMEFTGTPTSDTSGKRSLIYYRSTNGVTGPGATCGTFIDSVASLNSVIVASPNSDKVAIVYTKERGNPSWRIKNFGDNDDVWVKEIPNLTTPWSSATTTRIMHFNDTAEFISSSGRGFVLRAQEVTALYDATDCLHVVFTAGWHDTATFYYLIFPERMFHWSSCAASCVASVTSQLTGTLGGTACQPGGGNNNFSKVNLTECTVGAEKRLYVVYTKVPSYDLTPDSSLADCSTGGFANNDVYVQGSNSGGNTWGAPINITNTHAAPAGCASGACNSESFTSSAMYSSDSLYIQYMNDKDAGDYALTTTEGLETTNPVINMTYPCYTITTAASLTFDDLSMGTIDYPFHTTPGAGPNHTASHSVTLRNEGNGPANYTRTVSYLSGSGWLSFDQPATSSVPAGCGNIQTTVITATGPATEGVYKANVNWTYTAKAVISTHVELYNFTNFLLETPVAIRTSAARLNVAQTGRVGAQKSGGEFQFFSDLTHEYLFDGGPILGTSATNLSLSVFTDSVGIWGGGDTLLGRIFAESTFALVDYDSTSSPNFRRAKGLGQNRDSTIEFEVNYYASKAPAAPDNRFFVGKYDFYAGDKNPGATINGVTLAFGTDYDVPDDSSDNQSGFDEPRQMVYEQGKNGTATQRFAALAGIRGDNLPLEGGTVLANPRVIYPTGYLADPNGGYAHNYLWNTMQSMVGYSSSDTMTDLHSLLVFAKGIQIKPKATAVFTIYVIWAAEPAGGSLGGLQATVDAAKTFICTYVSPGAGFCCSCGDADGSGGTPDISDAVFLIAYIFGGGPAPSPLCNGDADGSGGTPDISDAVFLIAYIFGGGPAPCCAGPC